MLRTALILLAFLSSGTHPASGLERDRDSRCAAYRPSQDVFPTPKRVRVAGPMTDTWAPGDDCCLNDLPCCRK